MQSVLRNVISHLAWRKTCMYARFFSLPRPLIDQGELQMPNLVKMTLKLNATAGAGVRGISRRRSSDDISNKNCALGLGLDRNRERWDLVFTQVRAPEMFATCHVSHETNWWSPFTRPKTVNPLASCNREIRQLRKVLSASASLYLRVRIKANASSSSRAVVCRGDASEPLKASGLE